MGEASPHYLDIVVKVKPKYAVLASEKQADDSIETASASSGSYDALIYADPLNLLELKPDDKELPGDQPETLGGLPFAGVEQVLIHWERYRTYISSFLFGEKAAWKMLSRLFQSAKGASEKPKEALFEFQGQFLKSVLNRQVLANRSLRLWWCSDAPELVSLPWELMVQVRESDKDYPLSFVRGMPPDENNQVPKIPLTLGKPLRLALIYEPNMASKALLAAFDKLSPEKIRVERKAEASRRAIQEAVQEGFELIHIIADGTVSLANEGSLYLRKSGAAKTDPSPHQRRLFRFLLPIHQLLKPVLPGGFNHWLENLLEAKLDIEKCSP